MSQIYKIKHTHGQTEVHEGWEAAWAALVAVHGDDLYAYDSGEVDAAVAPTGHALVWQTEDDSVDDDGARAVASVYAVDAEG
jgi:hypothetical protein